MANLLRLVVVAAALRQVVIIRSQSRHTYGFEPFDLPMLELQALTTATSESQKLLFEPVDESGSLFWANGVDRHVLATAASQAILTHATFEMLDTSIPNDSLAEVSTIAAEIGCEMNQNTQVVDMTNPNMSRTRRLEILREAGVFIQSTCKYDNFSSPENAPSVLLIREDGQYHVGWRLATGPAAVGNIGAPGKTKRRNYNGVLGQFALKSRLHMTQTAMEPEIAFIMASLAIVSSGSKLKVLDPCCGSAGLLLCAAARGASHLVGVDRNGTAFVGAQGDFEKHGLPSPTLVEGDVLQPHRTPALCEQEAFDAIVCDPPYNIGAPVLVDGRDGRPPSYHEDADYGVGTTVDTANSNVATTNVPEAAIPDLTAGVLDIARRVLVIGGRIVFFLPVRGDEAALPLLQTRQMRDYMSTHKEEKHAGGSLKVVHGRLQRFSPTFSRWLICMERVR